MNAPPGYQCYKTDVSLVFYNIIFAEETGFPIVREAIKVDKNLHVQLQKCGRPSR